MPKIHVTSYGKLLLHIDVDMQVGPEDGSTKKFQPNTEIDIPDDILAQIKVQIKRGIRGLVENKPTSHFTISSELMDQIDSPPEHKWTEDTAWDAIDELLHTIYEQQSKNELTNMVVNAIHPEQSDRLKWIESAIEDEAVDDPRIISAAQFLRNL